MPDYKEMYFKLFRATEDAITCLLAAQSPEKLGALY